MTIKFRAKTPQGFTVDSPLQPFIFPDGAAHVKGADSEQTFQYQIADVRGLDHTDLFLLAMWAEAVDDRKEKKVVFLPYLPGARADRGTPEGAYVYAEFINSLYADQIILLDPHSPVMPGLLSNSDKLDPKSHVTVFPFQRIIKNRIQDGTSDSRPQPYVGVIAPDKGAVERASKAAKVMGVPVYRAGKTRDFNTGQLTGFHMEDELPETGRLLLVDDICDGGGTFIGLAQATGLPRERVDLWVTHGVFSKGLNELMDTFDVIHTTNSYFDAAKNVDMMMSTFFGNKQKWSGKFDEHFKIHDITPYLTEAISNE